MNKIICRCGGTFELATDTFQDYRGVREPIYICPKCYIWFPADIKEIITESIDLLNSASMIVDNKEIYNNLLKLCYELTTEEIEKEE